MTQGKLTHFNYSLQQTESPELQKQFNEFLLQQYEAYAQDFNLWHDKLSEKMLGQLSLWWFSVGSRAMPWDPPIYQPFFYALALKDFSQRHGLTHVKISSAPLLLAEFLREIDPTSSYEFEFEKAVTETLKNKIKSFLSPYWELTRVFRDTFLNSNKLTIQKSYDLGVYSQSWGLEHYKRVGDHFFGRMLEDVPSNQKVLWIYNPSVKITTFEKNEMKKIFHNKDLIFLEDYWTIGDAFKILAHFFQYKFQSLFLTNIPSTKIGNNQSKVFAKLYVKTLIQKRYPVTEIKVHHFFQKLHKQTKLKKLLFPFEDKGLERAIILATPKTCPTLAYAHAIHNAGHLYFYKNPKSTGYPPRPSTIVCTGNTAAEWIINKSGLSPQKVVVVGSNRYREIAAPTLFEWKPKNILFLSGTGYEVSMFANWVEELRDILKEFNLTIRKYPYSWQAEQDKGIEQIKRYCQVTQNNKSLMEQVAEADIIISSSSSAGLEAVMGRKLLINANLHHIIPLDPLADKGNHKAIFRCMTSTEFRSTIQSIKKMSVSEVQQALDDQLAYTLTLYKKPDLTFFWN